MTAICWVTLVMLAHAFLVIATAVQGHTEQSGSNTADALITLTVNEFRRLFIALLLGLILPALHTSAWTKRASALRSAEGDARG